jgi:hypothetical protein
MNCEGTKKLWMDAICEQIPCRNCHYSLLIVMVVAHVVDEMPACIQRCIIQTGASRLRPLT